MEVKIMRISDLRALCMLAFSFVLLILGVVSVIASPTGEELGDWDWVTPTNSYAVIGDVEVNGVSIVREGVENEGDITLPKQGDIIRAPWGGYAWDLSVEGEPSVFQVILRELAQGCGQSTGCESVAVHGYLPNGSWGVRIYTSEDIHQNYLPNIFR